MRAAIRAVWCLPARNRVTVLTATGRGFTRRASSVAPHPRRAMSSNISEPLNATRSIRNDRLDPSRCVRQELFFAIRCKPAGPVQNGDVARERKVFYPGLGRYFQALRVAKGWNQLQTVRLAERRGIALSYQALRSLEEGRTRHPDPAVLKTLALLYGVPLSDLHAVLARYGAAPPTQEGGRDARDALIDQQHRQIERLQAKVEHLTRQLKRVIVVAGLNEEEDAPSGRSPVKGRRASSS